MGSDGLAFRLRRRSLAALRRNARRPYGYAGVSALRSSLTLPRFPMLLQRKNLKRFTKPSLYSKNHEYQYIHLILN